MIAIAASIAWFAVTTTLLRADQGLPVAEIEHEGPVDFAKQIMPLLRRNCVACHNATEAAGGLVLETPESILEGGDEGPGLVPGNAAESLVFQLAAHRRESFMPPEDNDVGAKNLTPEEIGWFKLWIDQGAKGTTGVATSIDWQLPPPGATPIYAVAVSPDGRFVAAGRANQIPIYSLGTRQEFNRLIDPALRVRGRDGKSDAAHRDAVQSLAFCSDGRRLASGGFRTAKIWVRRDGVQTGQPFDTNVEIDAFAVSGDQRRAAIAQADGKLRIYDLVSGTEVFSIDSSTASITHLSLDHDGSWLAAASNRIVRQWNVATGQQAPLVEHPCDVTSIAIVGEEHQLVSGGADHLIRLWNSTDGSAIGTFTGHTAPITALLGIPGQSDRLVSASFDGTARLWDTSTEEVVQKFDHAAAIVTVDVAADRQRIATGAETGSTKLWNLGDGQLIAELVDDAGASETTSELQRNVQLTNKHVQNAQSDVDAATKRLQIEEANAEAAAKKLADAETAAKEKAESLEKASEAEKAAALQAKRGAEQAVTLARQNAEKAREAAKRIAADLPRLQLALKQRRQRHKVAEEKLAQSQAATQTRIAEIQTRIARKVKADRAVADVQTRRRFAGEQEEGVAEPLASEAAAADLEKSAADAALAELRPPVQSASFSRDGSRLAVLSGDRVACYASDAGTPLYPLDLRPSDQGTLVAAHLIAQDRIIAVTSDRSLTTWTSHPTWQLERTIGAVDSTVALVDRVTALDFSPDGTLLATGGGVPSRSGEVKLWNIETGELVRTIADSHSDTVLGAAFSPDGKYLATCGADRMMKVFETESGRVVKSFEGHAHHVLGVSWRADARVLATSGADRVVKVWDFQSGKAIRTIEGFQKEVTAIEFLGLSDQFVLSTGDQQVVTRNTAGGSGPTFAGGTDFMFHVRASEDGQTIAAGGQDSVLRVWDHQGGDLATFAPTTQPQPE